MTREDAIRILASSCIPGSKQTEALETLIPELAESEDERIRKAIIHYILYETKGAISEATEHTWVKWLEKQKEQKPYIDFVIKPHKGDDNNPYDMRVSEAQEYAIKRGFGIPFNDGEVYVDERHMTQTIGNILRWADEHPKEQKLVEWSEDEFHKTTNLVYKAIRKALASLAVYAEDEALLDSKEENLCYYSQRCTEEIFKFLRPSWKPSKEELAKKHLDGYCMGREDTLREMKDFVESHFNCENAKKGTPIVYNTQSGTATLKAEGQSGTSTLKAEG